MLRPLVTASSALTRHVHTALRLAAGSAWFWYLAILSLQLKVIGGIWRYRDLSPGDTASYFVTASQWYREGRTHMALSPLYTAFYGFLISVAPDAYTATTAHRVIIVLALSLLILAIMRRLLPPALAWFVTAWWVVLPIAFDSVYEVHLFALLPLVLACLTILCFPGPWGRGGAIGILLLSTLLLRTEHGLTAGLLAACVLAYELWRFHVNGRLPHRRAVYLWCYGLPVVAACAVALFFHSRAHDKIPYLFDSLRAKHTLNICQVYAFGYQQRHPGPGPSPWLQCELLMNTTFGRPQVSLAEAIVRNPWAMTQHVAWNLGLIPSGLQVLLFNATSGRYNPDYYPVKTRSTFALWASVALLSIYVAGLGSLHRHWQHVWTELLRPRIWGWLTLACMVPMAVLVMLTQRPRPSYLFSFGLFLMALAGLCVYAITHRVTRLRPSPALSAVVAVLLILSVPSYYRPAARGAPPLLVEHYRRLLPFQDTLQTPGAVLLAANFPSELCSYIPPGPPYCTGTWYWQLRPEVRSRADWPAVMERHGINLLYADESVLADAQRPQLLEDPAAYGWEVVASQKVGRQWALLRRQPSR